MLKLVSNVRLFNSAICFMLLLTSCGVAPQIILSNGKIFTADTSQLYVDALAIKGNRILARGKTSEIIQLARKKTRIIDLNGKTVLPGFNDAHEHVGWNTLHGNTYQYQSADVAGPDKKMIIDSLISLLARSTSGQWIYGTIGLKAFTDSSRLRREFLDSIAPNNPLMLQVWWGHGSIVNSRALKTLNINDDQTDPVGGWYERIKGTGKLSGALYEYAQWPFWRALYQSDKEAFEKDLKQVSDELIGYGVTTLQQMNSTINNDEVRCMFNKINSGMRFRIVPMIGSTIAGRSLHEKNYDDRLNDNQLYISGVKYVIDGTPLERTALMSMPYHGNLRWYGRLNFPTDTVRQILRESLNNEHQTMLHIVGDSAMTIVLQIMKEMKCDAVWKTKRLRIEHNSSGRLTKEQLLHIKDLGLIMMHTPQYGHNSKLATLLQMGIPIGIAPDGILNPYINIKIMISEMSPQQNLTIEQAVIAYTAGNAFAEFTDTNKGSLTVGKFADLTILSQDIFTVPLDKIPETKSLMTMVDGKIVYATSLLERDINSDPPK